MLIGAKMLDGHDEGALVSQSVSFMFSSLFQERSTVESPKSVALLERKKSILAQLSEH